MAVLHHLLQHQIGQHRFTSSIAPNEKHSHPPGKEVLATLQVFHHPVEDVGGTLVVVEVEPLIGDPDPGRQIPLVQLQLLLAVAGVLLAAPAVGAGSVAGRAILQVGAADVGVVAVQPGRLVVRKIPGADVSHRSIRLRTPNPLGAYDLGFCSFMACCISKCILSVNHLRPLEKAIGPMNSSL